MQRQPDTKIVHLEMQHMICGRLRICCSLSDRTDIKPCYFSSCKMIFNVIGGKFVNCGQGLALPVQHSGAHTVAYCIQNTIVRCAQGGKGRGE